MRCNLVGQGGLAQGEGGGEELCPRGWAGPVGGNGWLWVPTASPGRVHNLHSEDDSLCLRGCERPSNGNEKLAQVPGLRTQRRDAPVAPVAHRSPATPLRTSAPSQPSGRAGPKMQMEVQRPQNSPTTLRGKDKVAGLTRPALPVAHKAAVMKTRRLAQAQARRPMGQDAESGEKAARLWSIGFDTGAKTIQWGKESSFQPTVPGQRDVSMPKNGARLLPHTKDSNELAESKPRCESEHGGLLEGAREDGAAGLGSRRLLRSHTRPPRGAAGFAPGPREGSAKAAPEAEGTGGPRACAWNL